MKTRLLIFLFVVFFNNGLVFGQNKNYVTDWEKADSIELLGLPKSALDIVDKIYNKAIVEKNTPQFIKAVIFKILHILLSLSNILPLLT